MQISTPNLEGLIGSEFGQQAAAVASDTLTRLTGQLGPTPNEHGSSPELVEQVEPLPAELLQLASAPEQHAFKDLPPRWISLTQSLYHSDWIPHDKGLRPGTRLNPARASRARAMAKHFLDQTFPLQEGSHEDAISYLVYYNNVMVVMADGSTTGLLSPAHFCALSGSPENPESIALSKHALRAELVFNKNGAHGCDDIANIDEILVECTPAVLRNAPAAGATQQELQSYCQQRTSTAGNRCLTDREGADYRLAGQPLIIHDMRSLQQDIPVIARNALLSALAFCNDGKRAHNKIYVCIERPSFAGTLQQLDQVCNEIENSNHDSRVAITHSRGAVRAGVA